MKSWRAGVALVLLVAAACSPRPAGAPPGGLAASPSSPPVLGVVTSALTGAGVQATAGGQPTGADGRVSLYGLGPGATLTVTARLYAPAVATVGGDRTFSVQLSVATDPAAALAGVPGTTFAPSTSVAVQPAASLRADPTFAAVAPAMLVAAASAGGVGVIVLALPAGAALNPQTTGQLLDDAASYPGGVSVSGTVTELLAGVPVRYSESRQGEVDLAWLQAATIFIVDGRAPARAQLEALATALITTNRS